MRPLGTARRRRRRIGTRHALPLLLFASLARAEAPPPLRIVPADDAALASMLLIAAGPRAPVLLFDPQDTAPLRRQVAEAQRPVQCLMRGFAPPAARALLESVAGTPCTQVDDLLSLAKDLWPEARSAVLAPATNYAGLLRGAALAAAAGAALVPVKGESAAGAALSAWPLKTAYVLPGVKLPATAPGHPIVLGSPDAVVEATLNHLAEAPRLIVVANPKDRDGLFSPSSLSLLAPLIAAAHRAPLLLVSDSAASAVEAEVTRALTTYGLTPTYLYLVGDELALRSHVVPDPVLQAGGPLALGGAREVRVELFSELQHGRPQDYVVGRFVAEDAVLGSATLARQLHAGLGNGERVVILSNADDDFALGETISRTTASELRNAGIDVRARYRDAVTPAAIHSALEQAGLLLWEGHARDLTLEERGGAGAKRTPPLVVLQGCYTLDRSDPFILFERGTQAIVATSAAIYSSSGSAFARAFIDAVLYDAADLGTAVRNARNYLLAVTELKKRRGHDDWPKTYRAALAFALWGDPTARPELQTDTPKVAPATWQVEGAQLALRIPSQRLETAKVGRYTADPVPRAMLSGLILREEGRRQRVVKQLFFDALPAPQGITSACAPAPGWDVVSLFAPHTRTLSVLARPAGDGNAHGDFMLPLTPAAADCEATALR